MDEPTAAACRAAQVENIIRTLKANGEPLILTATTSPGVRPVDHVVVFRH
jgi:fructose transport system ATP-binding protein